MDQQKKSPIDPKDKVFQLRGNTKPRTSVFIAKIYLKKFEEVEIHALGEAIAGAVRCAQTLQRQGLATIEKIETLTQALERGKKVKIVVSLKVTADGKRRVNEEIKQ